MPQESNYIIRTRTRDDGTEQVYDALRRQYVALTPEESVRQRFVHYLITQCGYPSGLMGNEVVVRLNGMSKRCDTLVCDRQGNPLMIVEYKAPTVTITQKVFDQIWRYNTRLRVRYLVVSNGVQTYCACIDYATQSYRFLDTIPVYDKL